MYYNTTNLNGDNLKQEVSNTRTQEEKILRFYTHYNEIPIAPDFVWEELFKKRIPITSVRRGITNLTKQGKLIKTEETGIGFYGKKVCKWALNKK
tara:strand:- start:218 stop:502 length:285 start_codon:yes stop_codon:yes gene_type:complete